MPVFASAKPRLRDTFSAALHDTSQPKKEVLRMAMRKLSQPQMMK